MAVWEIWRSEAEDEVWIRTNWPLKPDVRGPTQLTDEVWRALERMGPFPQQWLFEDVRTSFEHQLNEAGLELKGYVGDHELSARHLRAAVAQAQASAVKERDFNHALQNATQDQTARRLDEDVDQAGNRSVLNFLLFPSPIFDQVLEASRNAVVLSVAALEAFINEVAQQELAIWGDEEDRLALESKWIVVPRLLTGGATFDKGRVPYQDFKRLVGLRNKLIHGKGSQAFFDVAALGASLRAYFYRPKWDVGPGDGRNACITTRAMILELSSLAGLPSPRFCSIVPQAKSDDLKAWSTAVILDGTRPDSDFSRITDRIPFWAVAEEE